MISHTTAITEGVDSFNDTPESGGPERNAVSVPAAGLLFAGPPTMSNTNTSATDSYGPVDPESVSVPSELSSEGTKLVYIYLQLSGESTVEELNRSLEMKTISLLPILKTLQSKELVDRQDEYYLPTAA